MNHFGIDSLLNAEIELNAPAEPTDLRFLLMCEHCEEMDEVDGATPSKAEMLRNSIGFDNDGNMIHATCEGEAWIFDAAEG